MKWSSHTQNTISSINVYLLFQLWTCEEQRRLEELLIEFPPEPIEMRRFAKIARALGNRTTKQVASRLQKYFQKLHAAGLPVPGRIPRGPRTYQNIRKNRMNKHLHRPTTFFPSNYVPVNMADDDDAHFNFLDPNTYRKSRNDGGMENVATGERDRFEMVETMVVDEQSDSEVSPGESDKAKIVRLVKRVKRDKEKNYKVETTNCDHTGYEVGQTRWLFLCRTSYLSFFLFILSVITAKRIQSPGRDGTACHVRTGPSIIAPTAWLRRCSPAAVIRSTTSSLVYVCPVNFDRNRMTMTRMTAMRKPIKISIYLMIPMPPTYMTKIICRISLPGRATLTTTSIQISCPNKLNRRTQLLIYFDYFFLFNKRNFFSINL